MKLFYLKTLKGSDRVYLTDTEPNDREVLIETISAKNRDDARAKLRPDGYEKYEHRPGYGFFLTP